MIAAKLPLSLCADASHIEKLEVDLSFPLHYNKEMDIQRFDDFNLLVVMQLSREKLGFSGFSIYHAYRRRVFFPPILCLCCCARALCLIADSLLL